MPLRRLERQAGERNIGAGLWAARGAEDISPIDAGHYACADFSAAILRNIRGVELKCNHRATRVEAALRVEMLTSMTTAIQLR